MPPILALPSPSLVSQHPSLPPLVLQRSRSPPLKPALQQSSLPSLESRPPDLLLLALLLLKSASFPQGFLQPSNNPPDYALVLHVENQVEGRMDQMEEQVMGHVH